MDPRVRIFRNDHASGAASARNKGVELASGEIIFFLDDDDEMLEAYCRHILDNSWLGSRVRWGFSSILICSGVDKSNLVLKERRRISAGRVSATRRVRDRIAGMGEGFWINKDLFLEVGALDPRQTIDEDTDLCMRLMGLGSAPWYGSAPGVVVYRGYRTGHPDSAQLTSSTPLLRGLECYRRTYEKNAKLFPGFSAERWFLGTRFINRAVKQRQPDMVKDFLEQVEPVTLRHALNLFFKLKELVHQIKRAG